MTYVKGTDEFADRQTVTYSFGWINLNCFDLIAYLYIQACKIKIKSNLFKKATKQHFLKASLHWTAPSFAHRRRTVSEDLVIDFSF